jgi:hypothetical protein
MHLVLPILAALIIFDWLKTGFIWSMLGMLGVFAIIAVLIVIAVAIWQNLIWPLLPSMSQAVDTDIGIAIGVAMSCAALILYPWLAIVLVRKALRLLRKRPPLAQP